MSNKKSGLGRGLSALLENIETDVTSKADATGLPTVAGAVAHISIDKIEANPFQPRTVFEREALEELSRSIKEHGIIQPITIRKMGYDRYQLISGERRLKASKMAGLQHIPAYIRIANDQSMLEMALVENIQRENLNPIEIALSYKRLLDECNLTQEELSARVSKNRSTISNYLRLLKLPGEIQAAIRDNRISMGHARAIINVENPAEQMEIFKNILSNDLSVRNVEELARTTQGPRKRTRIRAKALPYEVKKVQEDLARQLSAKVDIRQNAGGKGRIIINYSSPEELERLLEDLLR